ncbi:hypothetical protein BDV41DRAFT_520271 [Aspergillus transmontanensis]|uniref:Uncharacterized protein n=1 Tax=Aspergillus transmontanensis TaxID=1034304 RepID=A0A5N6WGD8_9EURO|nr:hypothetical protein BDV41DRAFT_520271 [Aspergillus transmontanensis]
MLGRAGWPDPRVRVLGLLTLTMYKSSKSESKADMTKRENSSRKNRGIKSPILVCLCATFFSMQPFSRPTLSVLTSRIHGRT